MDSLKRRCDLGRQSADAERLLWRMLRIRQLCDAKFRRQHQYGSYILDPYCVEHIVATEADGGQHQLPDEAALDLARTQYLAAKGIRLLRFTNLDILQETDGVLQVIEEALAEPSPQPSPTGSRSQPDW